MHTHAHTLTRAHCRSSYPYSSAYLPRTFSLLTARPGEKRRAAATAGISCRETQWLSPVSAVRRRRECSIGSIRTARSRRSEEGGRSANHSTAEQYTRPAGSDILFCRLPPCRVLSKRRCSVLPIAAPIWCVDLREYIPATSSRAPLTPPPPLRFSWVATADEV